MTPLLGKEGKVFKYKTICFSSFEASGGGGFDVETSYL